MDNRAVSPVVGKALEVGLVVMYIGLLTTTLYGTVVPDYRESTGAAVADRALALSAERIQQAVPPRVRAVDARLRIDLPRTIRDRPYAVGADGRTLVLAHPDPAIGGRAHLALPESVVRIEGEWSSRRPTLVHVYTADGGLVVRLENR